MWPSFLDGNAGLPSIYFLPWNCCARPIAASDPFALITVCCLQLACARQYLRSLLSTFCKSGQCLLPLYLGWRAGSPAVLHANAVDGRNLQPVSVLHGNAMVTAISVLCTGRSSTTSFILNYSRALYCSYLHSACVGRYPACLIWRLKYVEYTWWRGGWVA